MGAIVMLNLAPLPDTQPIPVKPFLSRDLFESFVNFGWKTDRHANRRRALGPFPFLGTFSYHSGLPLKYSSPDFTISGNERQAP